LELGFFSVRDNAIFALGVDFEKHWLKGIVGSVLMWALENTLVGAYETQLCYSGLDFMPLDQILNVSLNGFRK
jgi:hypothetical protein